MKVDTLVFGSRNALRALGVAKIGWDELGWGLAGAPVKNQERS